MAPDPGDDRAAERRVLRIVAQLQAEVGGRTGAVAPDADLERDLGLGSLERAELIARIEKAFSVKLPDETLVEAHTPRALRDAVQQALEAGGADVRAWAQAAEAAGGDADTEEDAGPVDVSVPDSIQTVVEVARYRAEGDARRRHLIVLGDRGEETALTFGTLWQRALRVAGGLTARGLRSGDRVGIVLPTSEGFFTSFLGVLCAAGVPVPIYPPIRVDQIGPYIDRHARLLENAGCRILIADEQLIAVAGLLRDRVAALEEAVTAAALEAGGEALAGPARVSPDALGLIQYTSGSTGDPKGVALRHRNLVANQRAIGGALAIGPDDVGVSWLPLYHDMGLIGMWLTALLHGIPTVLMSPLRFLSRPERWLWAFHRYRGTISAAPNFGYEICCRKVRDADIEGLSLATWRSALNGSEPVVPQTIDRFCARFAPYGFRRESMLPVYGLAETAVGLTSPPLDRPPRLDRVEREAFLQRGEAVPIGGEKASETGGDALVFVSAGVPMPGHEVRVTDAAAGGVDPLPARRQGAVIFRGPSTLKEYFGRPDATAAIRRSEEWIDTGDLGYLADGELFVTGRVKDLVIKGGRKYHPQDIEQAAWTVEGIRKGCVVAFAVPDLQSGEAIVVVAETRDPAAAGEELERRVSAAVQEAVGTPADRVVLVPPGTVPKTSSGKLRRREARERYLEGTLVRARGIAWRQIAGLALGSAPRRALGWLREGGRRLYGLYVLVVGSILLLLGVPFVLACRDAARAQRLGQAWLRVAASIVGMRPRRLGAPLPEGGMVLVSNHGSYLDPLALMAALERPPLFLAKAPVFEWPLVGRVVRRLGHLPVVRTSGAGRLASFGAAAEAARAGKLVHVFPEGTFTQATGTRPFRLGAFQLAATAGLRVVPVAIRGAREALGGDRWLPRPARLEVEVLAPIELPPGAGFREAAAARDQAREALAEATGEPILEIVSAALPPGVGEREQSGPG